MKKPLKVNLTFSADKLTIHGHGVSAEGVPIEDVLNSVSGYNLLELVDNDELLTSIGFDKINEWLTSRGYLVI